MSGSRAARFALAREAMHLRRRVLDLVSADPARSPPLPPASAETWQVVLRAECCALPIAAEIRSRGLEDRLDASARGALRSAELREAQRVLAARTTLDALDAVGSRLGVPIVALKGGAVAARPGAPAFDLGDVDVLVAKDALERVWSALRDRGWTPTREANRPGMETGRNHLDPLVPPFSGLPVELHREARYGQIGLISPDYEPIEGRASLGRLHRVDATRMMLWHATVHHPHRRGHLRDLFMLADMLHQLAPRERDAVDRSVGADPFAPELEAMLSAAASLGTTQGVPHSPSIERFVAWKYATLLKVDRVADEIVPGWSALGYIPLERPTLRAKALRAELWNAVGPVPRESRFRRGGSRPLPASLATAVGWLGRVAARVSMIAVLLLVGNRLRGVCDRLSAAPSR